MTLAEEVTTAVNRWNLVRGKVHARDDLIEAAADVAVADLIFRDLQEALEQATHDVFCRCDECARIDRDDTDHWIDYRNGLVA